MIRTSPTSKELPDPANQGGRRERKLQMMIDHIGAVAWELFEAQGFESVTMEAIAAAADVAKGTLYKHFPVKEALIQHRFEQDRRAMGPSVGAAVMAKTSCAERLAQLLKEEVIYLEKMRPYVGPFILFRLERQQLAQRAANASATDKFVTALLQVGQASGEINSDTPAEHMAEYFAFLRLGVMMRWLATPGISLDARNEEMLRLFLNGISRKAQS